MNEASIRLRCPNCDKQWQVKQRKLPEVDAHYTCPDCHAETRLAEFAKTSRDLEILKSFE